MTISSSLLGALVILGATTGTPTPYAETLVRRQATPALGKDSQDKYADWPAYEALPLNASHPFRAAWGVWGDKDELGGLNHITNQTILSAARSEVQIGKAINLNLLLDDPSPPFNPDRRGLSHSILPFSGYQDDQLVMNTQISTQYDGLRHFPYSDGGEQSSYRFYNDLLTFDELMSAAGVDGATLGLQNDASYGIAGRGVLFDWASWAESTGLEYSAFSNRSIPVSELEQVAQWQGLNISQAFSEPGAFAIVRTGVTQQYRALSAPEQTQVPFRGDDYAFIGVETSEDTLRWVWDHKLALVGSDNPAFERIPFGNAAPSGPARSLHQVLLSGWGVHIVELLDLEMLAQVCAEQRRYTFFFTLQNLNVMGGVASPPNAMAIM